MNENNNSFENALDALIAHLQELPKSTVKLINPKRYLIMMKAAAKLQQFLSQSVPEGEIEISLEEDFNLGAVSIELNDLSINDTEAFSSILRTADNLEIYPLTNERIKLELTFQGILKSVC